MTRNDAKMTRKKAKKRRKVVKKREVSALLLESFLVNIPPRTETRFKLKHSLDSDEEDERDEVKDSRLGDEDLSAQEDTTIVSCTATTARARLSTEYSALI